MTFKAVVLCGFLALSAQALGVSIVTGNPMNDNNFLISNGGINGYGLANGIGLTGAGLGGNLGLANSLSLANGLNWGNGANLGGAGFTNGFGNTGFINLAPVASGGVLPISSYGPVVPAGLNVVSDNAIEGAVLVTGELPFLSAVAFEGALASAGSGAAACGCGTGSIGIISESTSPVGNGLGFGAGINGFAGRGGLGLFY